MTILTSSISQALSKAVISQFAGTSPVLYNSQIGTPVYSDLNIVGDSYNLDGIKVSYLSINLPDVLFRVKKRKRVKVTGINGATSDVLENNGSEDAQISCSVRIYGTNTNYPATDLNNFYLMLQGNQPVQINSWYLNQFEIYYVVITEYELPQQTGNISEQQIKLTMRQTDPYQYPGLLNGQKEV